MKISELHVSGFRSLKEVVWKPGDLNVVIGPNASGKSNLLRALEMLRAAAKGSLQDYVQESGGMIPLLWNGERHPVMVQTDWRASEADPYFARLNYALALAPQHGVQFRMAEENLHVALVGTPVDGPLRPLIQRNGRTARVYDDQQTAHEIAPGNAPQQETILSAGDSPFIKSLLLHLSKVTMAGLIVYPGFDVGSQSAIRQAVVTQFAEQPSPDGENFVAVLHTLYTGNGDFEEAIDDGMRAAFEDYERLKFPPAAEQRIQLELKWKSLKKAQSATYLSDGTLRFLMLLTILANPAPPSLIAIDEPEIGLHPRMFPIIAEFAAAAARKTQIVFTTHSPEFLDAFRDTPPTTTVAQWDDGQTKLRTIDGEELKKWLQEYSLGRLFNSGQLESLG